MANVLNLALKKDVFERLQSGESNEIPIKKNDWWKKRLMDLDTGRFKYFDIASCTSGSSDKADYEIDHLEQRDDSFVVIVVLPMDSDPEETPGETEEPRVIPTTVTVIDNETMDPIELEPETVNPVTINEDGSVTQEHKPLSEELKNAIIEKLKAGIREKIQMEQEAPDVRVRVMEILNDFCNNKDVFVVNMPNVTIRNNGQIIGYRGSKRLVADRDSDVRFDFKKMFITQYGGVSDDAFVNEIKASFNELLQSSYVFINKKYCGFDTSDYGELIFKIAVATKKKYLFVNR